MAPEVLATESSDGHGFGEVERRLEAEFAAHVPPEVIRRCVSDTAARFEDARIRAYVPVLVERIARDWLRDAVRESQHRPPLRSLSMPADAMQGGNVGRAAADHH